MLSITAGKRVAVTVMLAGLAGGAVMAQQQGPARGNHEWATPVPQGKHHNLAATLETVQWGWLDPREKPKLVVESGDTVSIETMMHSHDKVQPGMTIEQAVDLRKANPSRDREQAEGRREAARFAGRAHLPAARVRAHQAGMSLNVSKSKD